MDHSLLTYTHLLAAVLVSEIKSTTIMPSSKLVEVKAHSAPNQKTKKGGFEITFIK